MGVRSDQYNQLKQSQKKRRRRRMTLILVGCIVLVILAGGLLFTYSASHGKAHHVITSSQSVKKSSSKKQASSSSSVSNDKAVTDLAPYTQYSGTYKVLAQTYSLDFSKATLTFVGNPSQTYNFDKVVSHADGTLTITLHYSTTVNGKAKTQYSTVLFAPAGKQVVKNLQSGKAMADKTDSSKARFSITGFQNDANNFDLTAVYTAFANNTTSQTNGQSNALIFTKQ